MSKQELLKKERSRIADRVTRKCFITTLVGALSIFAMAPPIIEMIKHHKGIVQDVLLFGLLILPIAYAKVLAIAINHFTVGSSYYLSYFDSGVVDPYLDAPIPIEYVTFEEWLKLEPEKNFFAVQNNFDPIDHSPRFVRLFHVGKNEKVDKEIRFCSIQQYKKFIAKAKCLKTNNSAVRRISEIFVKKIIAMPICIGMDSALELVAVDDWEEILNIPVPEHKEDVDEFKSVISSLCKRNRFETRFGFSKELVSVLCERENEPIQSESNRAVTRKLRELLNRLTL